MNGLPSVLFNIGGDFKVIHFSFNCQLMSVSLDQDDENEPGLGLTKIKKSKTL